MLHSSTLTSFLTFFCSDIIKAMRLVFERMKLVVEPSGAAGLAAVLTDDFATAVTRAQTAAGKTGAGTASSNVRGGNSLSVGVVLCGGNLDFDAKGFWREDNWQPAH